MIEDVTKISDKTTPQANAIDVNCTNGLRGLRLMMCRVLRFSDVDRAVVFALLTRVWQVIAGPITVLIMTRFITPEVQGFYYTFAGLLALQSFVELGLYNVIISVASHEWANLRLSVNKQIEGDPDARSRLICLGRQIFRFAGF